MVRKEAIKEDTNELSVLFPKVDAERDHIIILNCQIPDDLRKKRISSKGVDKYAATKGGILLDGELHEFYQIFNFTQCFLSSIMMRFICLRRRHVVVLFLGLYRVLTGDWIGLLEERRVDSTEIEIFKLSERKMENRENSCLFLFSFRTSKKECLDGIIYRWRKVFDEIKRVIRGLTCEE